MRKGPSTGSEYMLPDERFSFASEFAIIFAHEGRHSCADHLQLRLVSRRESNKREGAVQIEHRYLRFHRLPMSNSTITPH